jgi:L-2,4-diaminobutyrate decarboxylase
MDSTELNKLYNTQHFRAIGHQLIDQMSNYLEACYSNDILVNNYQKPVQILENWSIFLDQNPSLNSYFDKILTDSIHLHNPHYIGHQVSAPAPIAAFGGLISDVLNNGMAVYEMGAVANVLERKTIEIITEAIGYGETAGGILTSGGTLANLTALLTARAHKVAHNVWKEGNNGHQLAVMVSEQAHYCIDRAVRIMGLGELGLIKVPTDDNFRMDTKVLSGLIKKAKEDNIQVFAIVGSACSTVTGAYDPLEEIADFALENDLWFHVDGAHGSAVVFSEKYASLVKGINKADSVVIDCHKMMMTPTIATAILYKNVSQADSTFNLKAEYLYDKESEVEWFDTGKRTFECTKLMMCVKFMAIYLEGGAKAIQQNIDRLYDNAKIFSRFIDEDENLELLIYPEANILCFRINDPSLTSEQLNLLNKEVRKAILEEGKFYIVQTEINNKIYLRTTVMNPFTNEQIFRDLIENIKEKRDFILKQG